MIQKVTPIISELEEDEVRSILQASERHDVPFGNLPVKAFAEDALIREAVAQYWEPSYSNKNVQSDLWSMMYNIRPQGLASLYDKQDRYDFPVRAKIILTYPLREIWEADAEIPVHRLGEIFTITHDMYLHIYDLDDAKWQSEGHQDKVPRANGFLLNRAKGEHVWGHDMSDLVFEYVGFYPNQNWPKKQQKKARMIVVDNMDDLPGDDDGDLIHPDRLEKEIKTVLMPIDKDKHAGQCPFIGTFTFFIGS